MKKRNPSMLSLICLALVPILPSIIMICSNVEGEEILHLGATVSFQTRLGIQLKDILNMNADLLNKAGGLTVGGKTYMIKYHIYDDKYDPDTGRAAMEKLVFEDGIKFNVGTFGSGPTLAMRSISESNKIPIFGGAGSEKLLAPQGKYFVHTYPTQFVIGYVKSLHQIRPDIKSVLLCTSDDETGHTLVPMVEKAYNFFGIKPLGTLFFKRGEMNFSHVGTKVIALKPDYFSPIGMTVEAENVQLVKAVRDAGYKGTVGLHLVSQTVVQNIIEKVGLKGTEGIYLGIYDPTSPVIEKKPAGAIEFRKNYEKYYGKWEIEALLWAGCWYSWLAAVKKANSIDPDQVVGAVDKNLTVSTPIGPGKFFCRPDLGNNRYCDYATVIRAGVFKDGKIVFLFEKDVDYAIDAIGEVYGMKMRK